MLIVTFIPKEFKYKFYSMHHGVKMTMYWRFSCTISQSEPEYNNIEVFYTVLFYENFTSERLRCLTVTKISLSICCTFWDQLLSLGSGEGSWDSTHSWVVNMGIPLDGELLVIIRQAWLWKVVGSMFGEYHAPCKLRICFVNFKKE